MRYAKMLQDKPSETPKTWVSFKGLVLILVGLDDGPLATKEQYANFLPSFAFLHKNGVISRFGKAIGTAEDLTILGSYNGEEKPHDPSTV